MSTTIDNRVVKMTFDNKQFEQGISATAKLLDQFEKKLRFEGAEEGIGKVQQAIGRIGNKLDGPKKKFEDLKNKVLGNFSDISKAAENTDISALGNAAQDAAGDINNAMGSIDMSSVNNETTAAAEGFSALEAVALGALMNIGAQIENFAINKAKQLVNGFISPVKEGFSEYQTQIGAIQTIMANTEMDFNSAADVQTVNDTLDDLNTYADKTIYNFTEMTRNIGTFTAAGLGLDESAESIKGIANLAALSGSNSEQASRAMYQLSQALSTGSLKLQDWNSVVNAGMGGTIFQEQLKATARAHGVAVDELIERQGSFRESLQEGWISSEILSETLRNMTISYEKVGDEAYNAALKNLMNAGYTKDAAVETLRLAKAGEEAATKVRTWSQLWETVGEAIGSNWSQIWRSIIGDFAEATDLFTRLNNNISGLVDNMLGGIVRVFDEWRKGGGRTALFGDIMKDEEGNTIYDEVTGEAKRISGALDYLIEAIAKPLQAIKDAFDAVFGVELYNPDDPKNPLLAASQDLVGFTLAFRDFTKSLVISDDVTTGIRKIFTAIFSVLDIGIRIVLDIGAAFFTLLDILRMFTDPLVDIAFTIVGVFGDAITWLHDTILLTTNAFKMFIAGVDQSVGGIIPRIKEFVKGIFEFLDIPGKIRTVGKFFGTIFDGIYDALAHIPEMFSGIIGFFGGVFGDITKFFTDCTYEIDTFDETTNAAAKKQVNLIDFIKHNVLAFFEGVLSFIGKIFPPFNAVVEALGGAGKEAGKGLDSLRESVSSFIQDVLQKVSDFMNAVGSLAIAIGSFVKSAWDMFVAWEPVAKFFELLNGIKTAVIDGIVSIPDRIAGFGSMIFGEFSKASEGFDLIKSIGDVTDYISKLTPQKAIEDVKNFATGIVDGFNSMNAVLGDKERGTEKWELLTSTLEKVNGAFGGLIRTSNGLFGYLSETFPSMSPIISEFGTSVESSIFYIHDLVQGRVASVIKKSHNIPELIWNIFVEIFDVIGDGIKGIFDKLGSLTPKKIIDIVTTPFRALSNFIKDTFPNIAGFIDGFWKSFDSFVDGLGISGITFSNVIDIIKNNVYNFLTNLPGPFGPTFKTILDSVSNFVDNFSFEKAFETVSNWTSNVKQEFDNFVAGFPGSLTEIPGKIAGIFTGFVGESEKAVGTTKEHIAKVPGFFETHLGEIGKPVDNAIDNFKRFVDSINPENWPEPAKKIYEWFNEHIIKAMDKVSEYLENLPDKLKAGFAKIADFLGSDEAMAMFNKVAEVVKSILKIKLLFSVDSLVKGLGRLTRGIGKYFSRKDKDGIGVTMKYIGEALLMIAGALFIIAQIPQKQLDKARNAIIAIFGVLGAFLGVSALLQKFTGLKVGKVLSSIRDAALGMLMAVGAIYLLVPALLAVKAAFGSDPVGMFGAFVGAVAMIGLIGLALAGISRVAVDGKAVKKVAEGVLIASASIFVISYAIKQLIEIMPPDQIESAKIAIAGLGILFVVLAGALWLLTSEVPDSGALIKTAASLAIASAALFIIALAISTIAEMPWQGISVATVALAALVGVFGLLAYFTNGIDLIATAASLVIFSAAIGIMAISLGMLSMCDPGRLTQAAVAIGALIAVFGIVAAVLASPPLFVGAAIVLPALALAFIGVGAGALLLSVGLLVAVEALKNLIAIGPSLTTFVTTISENLTNFALAAAAFLALGASLVVLGAGLLVFGAGALVAGAGLLVISTGIRTFLELVADLPELLQNAWETIQHIPEYIGEVLSNVLNNVTTWFQERIQQIGEFLGGVWESVSSWFGEKIEGIGTFLGGIKDKVVTFFTERGTDIGNFFTGAGEKIGSAFSNFGVKVGEFFGGIKDKVVSWFSERVSDLGERFESIKTKVGEFFSGIGEKISGFFTGLGSKIIGWISGAVSDAAQAGRNLIDGLIGGIRDGIEGMNHTISEAGQGVVNGFKSFFHIASPSKLMRDRIGKYLPMGIGEGIKRYSGSAIKQALATSKAILTAMDPGESEFNYGYSISSPTVTPVLDMSDVDSEFGKIENLLGSLDLSVVSRNTQNIDYSMNMDPIYGVLESYNSRFDKMSSQNEQLNQEIRALRTDMAQYSDAINHSAIVMDSGLLVGAITDKMDQALGTRQTLIERGVIRGQY